jgi:myo-inositol-1(or 4)-monophosphatase
LYADRCRISRHSFVAEEGHRSDTGSEFVWLVDPLDATNNYAHIFPIFAYPSAFIHAG